MTTDETGQGMLFAGLPDAPAAPERPDAFRGHVGGLVELAQAAMAARRERDAIEAEQAAEDAARLAELDAAAAARNDEPAQIEPDHAASAPQDAPPGNVVRLQRAAKVRKPKGESEAAGGEFFKMDRVVWNSVCALGLNPAVAYFVLARGTGGDNRTSFWSVNSIEKWTSVSRAHANKAVKDLIAAGFVRQDRGGSYPRYYMMPADEINGVGSLSGAERRVYETIADLIEGGAEQESAWVPKVARAGWDAPNPYAIARGLARRGFLTDLGGQNFGLTPRRSEPEWVWLPNALVDGVAGETPPLELVRQALSVDLLGLFVDLYAAHALPSNGGLDWRPGSGLWRSFERVKVGERGAYVVWGWKPEGYTSGSGRPPGWARYQGNSPEGVEADSKAFFGALRELERVGLIEYVAHLVEDPKHPDAQIIHPIPDGNGEAWERAVSVAAEAAAVRMATPERVASARKSGCRIYAPVEARRKEAGVVGILRLRYKPKTKATAIWVQQAEALTEIVSRYDRLDAAGALRNLDAPCNIKGHQGS